VSSFNELTKGFIAKLIAKSTVNAHTLILLFSILSRLCLCITLTVFCIIYLGLNGAVFCQQSAGLTNLRTNILLYITYQYKISVSN